MRRENASDIGTVKEFKNGNINLSINVNRLFENGGNCSDIELILWVLDNIDTSLISDEFCLSNYDTGAILYNVFSDLCYIISVSDIDNVLNAGKTLKLYGHTPDKYERELIKKYWND